MKRISTETTWVALGLLALSLCACNSPEPIADEKTETSQVAEKQEKAQKETPKTRLSKSPTLRFPTISSPMEPVEMTGASLVITGTVAILDDGTPQEWTCDSTKCDLSGTVSALAVKDNSPLQIAVSPEVSAKALTQWVKALGGDTPRHFLASGPKSETGSLLIKPGRIFPFVASPGSWKHTIRKPLQGEDKAVKEAAEGPKVSVRGGALTVTEDCNDPTLSRKTRRHIRHFVACYRSYSMQPNPKEGTINMVWGVEPSGKIAQPTFSSEELKAESLTACLEETARSIGYTPFDERGEQCELSWSLRFRQRKEKAEGESPEKKKDSLTNGHVTLTVTNKTVSLSAGPSATTKIVSMDDRSEMEKEVGLLLSKNQKSALVTYGKKATAQHIYEVSGLLARLGITDLRLAHPRN